jgi:hypothetical protein
MDALFTGIVQRLNCLVSQLLPREAGSQAAQRLTVHNVKNDRVHNGDFVQKYSVQNDRVHNGDFVQKYSVQNDRVHNGQSVQNCRVQKMQSSELRSPELRSQDRAQAVNGINNQLRDRLCGRTDRLCGSAAVSAAALFNRSSGERM